jgi:hypothetical protein
MMDLVLLSSLPPCAPPLRVTAQVMMNLVLLSSYPPARRVHSTLTD